jgi:hypothetical protein
MSSATPCIDLPFLAITFVIKLFTGVTHTWSPLEGDAGNVTVVAEAFAST